MGNAGPCREKREQLGALAMEQEREMELGGPRGTRFSRGLEATPSQKSTS